MMKDLFGVYGGIVEEIRDPNRMGRIKARVPAVFGTASEVPTDMLPWALPRGMPFGNSNDSGGISWLPAKGDTVWVTFLDGEPEKPLWEWGVAPIAYGSYLHKYNELGGNPKRSALTRYGHIIEFNSSSIIVTTATGEAAIFDSANHTIQLQNEARYSVRIDLEEITIKAGTQMIKVDNTGTQISAFCKDFHVAATKDVKVKGQTFDVKAFREIAMDASTSIDLNSMTKVSVTSEGEVTVTVGSSTITVTDASMSLSVGGRTLTISPAGFSFT